MKIGTAVMAAALLASTGARAEEIVGTTGPGESARSAVFEFNFSRYRPHVEDEAALAGGSPYRDVFGSKKMWLFEGELDLELFQAFGTLSVGVAAGYASVYGHGVVARTGEVAPDLTVLKMVPVRALAVYRFDWAARQLGVPFVPFAKLGPAYTFWWITNGNGDYATFGDSSEAVGAKWGYELALGLALELNFFDPKLGREFDADFGVNRVWATAQWVKLSADNFGRAGMVLSDTTWLFGLGFEY